MGTDVWAYAKSSGHVAGADLTGFRVDASDGHVGRIDKHSADVGRSYIVVDTGPWLLRRHVLVPAGQVRLVDLETETVHLSATKKQIKESPDFERGQQDDAAFIRLTEQHYINGHS
ncbi:PRC domain containing protein [Streptomyces venezuelae]|uniref:PRC domain containing protein n=1 Tax=Streptomyces venezuelae TaxID=54571 RepID=A0A5P2D7Z4_STRVZ|nr:PRC-barrel domain containing protein [Streptomyces venezuelae]QES49259.1 PRC domain containing protein [Streptomyces venezuelae]